MLKFFAEKSVSSFCSYSHFFSKKYQNIVCIESAKKVNEMTLNELVKLTTLWTTGPCMTMKMAIFFQHSFEPKFCNAYPPSYSHFFIIWGAPSEKVPSNMHKMHGFRSSSAWESIIPSGLFSPFIHSVVSNDFVSLIRLRTRRTTTTQNRKLFVY